MRAICFCDIWWIYLRKHIKPQGTCCCWNCAHFWKMLKTKLTDPFTSHCIHIISSTQSSINLNMLSFGGLLCVIKSQARYFCNWWTNASTRGGSIEIKMIVLLILAYTYLNTKLEIFLTKHTRVQWVIKSSYPFINSSFVVGYENLVLHINNISKLTGSLSLLSVCLTIHTVIW